ncbi:MAG TPA: glutamate-5-semialdehyde dehydrogenase [Terrimicrobiaceae bacterium]|nr:glutamate-5-semialdehyde dehydrogenase [Terrimicrobiaceae bacterium]
MSLEAQIHSIGQNARAAARALAALPAAQKNAILHGMADALVADAPAILEANARDVASAEANGLNQAAVDRLRLSGKRIAEIADGIRQVAALEDPVGKTMLEWTRPNGLQIRRVRAPIGVIGIIYESRPNVTSDAAVLCIKTGNAVILRGGSEALHSNLAIATALQAGGAAHGLPPAAVQLIPTKDRDAVRIMAQMDAHIDLIIPRGGHALIEAVVAHARMPVIKHYHGVCHVYVDKDADLAMAERIVLNAKCQRPGVCNSMETLLVHRDVAEEFFETSAPAFREAGVEIHADKTALALLSRLNFGRVRLAEEADWSTEYLDLIFSLRVVDDMAQAIEHMEKYGSHHSDAIVTRDAGTAEQFLNAVDSATVYWNASTRFTDGGEFGFGAEIGISTDKLHARGPMGLEELTTYKYQIRGNGQIRP